MSENDSDWIYISESRIRDDTNRISIPEALFSEDKANILTDNEDAAWSYDRSGLVIISNRKLVGGKYKYIDTNGITNRVTRVPGRFFSDYDGPRGPIDEGKTKYDPKFEYGQRVFFACRKGMERGDTRSSYVLTQEQLTDIMGDGDFGDSFDSPPKFI